MPLTELIDQISLELSGIRTKKVIEKIIQYHRIQASTPFFESLKFIKSKLEDYGDKKAHIHEYIADGTKRVYNWSSPLSWDITSGKLKLIEPKEEILADFSIEPESICTHSKPVESVIAEVVHIGKATDEDLKNDICGKVVLTSGAPRSLIEKLAEKKASGIIAYPSLEKAGKYHEMIRYVGLWPDADNLSKSSWGFSISTKKALELINYLKEGKKIVVEANIDSKLYPGKLHVLSTVIKGSKEPNKEIILCAHICHPKPSANDNASGSALLLEIYKTISSLIKHHKIDRPDISIRFLWVPEFHGTIPWIQQMKKRGDFEPLTCLNLDMVGEDPQLIGYPFVVSQTSITTPSIINDLITALLDIIKDDKRLTEPNGWQRPWNYRMKPYSGGSDHILFTDEPLRIPAVMFGHPDQFHHTNLDTIDKVDTTTLKRVGVLTVLTVLILDSPTKYQNIYLKGYWHGFHKRRANLFLLLEKYKNYNQNNNYGDHPIDLYKQLIDYALYFEFRILDSLTHKEVIKTVKDIVKNDYQNIMKLFSTYIEKNELASKKEQLTNKMELVPKRLWKGPINYKVLSKLEKPEMKDVEKEDINKLYDFLKNEHYDYGGFVLELINLINNKRTLSEIYVSLCFATADIIDISSLIAFYEKLAEIELISLH